MKCATRPSVLRVAAVLGFVLTLANPRPSRAQGAVGTAEGLRLELSDDGTIRSLSAAGRELASKQTPSGFFLREVAAERPDLVANGSFETGTDRPASWTWKNNPSGSWTWEASGRSGAKSLVLATAGESPRGGPDLLSTAFPVLPNTPYGFSCAVKAEGLTRGLDISVVEQDGEGRVAERNTRRTISGTRDWTPVSLSFTTGPTAARAYVQVSLSSGRGKAWVDDVSVRDLFAGRVPTALGGKVVADAEGLTQTQTRDGMTVVARYSNVGGAVRVDATLTDSTGRDRAFELSFRLPIAPEGWNWEKNLFESAPIRAGTRYEELDTAFGDQTHSIYPLATIRSDAAELSLAVPMQPQLQRFGCDTREGLRSVWDVGVSPATTRTPSSARISFWVLASDPRWGFRGAAERYFAIQSEAFQSPEHRAGSWIVCSPDKAVRDVPDPLDFGWGYHESSSTLDFDIHNKILSLRYVDVSGYFRSLPGVTAQPEYDVLHRTLDEDAAAGSGSINGAPRRDLAQAAINCSPYDDQGRYPVFEKPYFWYGNRLQIYPMSPDPEIPAPSFWSVALDYWIERPIATASKSGGRLDGVFLDDLSDNFASIENYRRPHWAYGDEPLAFSYASGKVVRFNGLAMARFCAALRKRLHELKMVSFGSTSLGATGWFARHLDAMGGEVPGAEPEERVSVRRFFSYGKPWSNLLVPRGKEGLSSDVVAAYLAQALRLGFFPGFSGRYWTDRSSYERDRPLFRRYVPLIREATEAGWRPVPAAASSAADISLERFDTEKSGVFYLTAYNKGSSRTEFRVKLDSARLRLKEGRTEIQDRLRARAITGEWRDGNLEFPDSLAPGEVTLYRISVDRAPAGSPSAPSSSPSR